MPNKLAQKIYRVIIVPDMQVPFHDRRTLKAVEDYMADHKWDEWVCLGDFMDFDFISSFNKEYLRRLEGRRFQEDYGRGNEILDRHQEIVRRKNPDAKFTLLEGNHEYRVTRFIDASPSVEGYLEVPAGLKLKERDMKWVPSWSEGKLHRVGNAYFSHGIYTNMYHAKKMVDAFGVSIYYGHTHDVMSVPKVLRGKDKTIEGHSMGCLCDYNQSYIKGKPTNWQQAFGVGYFYPDGYYNIYTVRIFNHRFVSPEGKSYQG